MSIINTGMTESETEIDEFDQFLNVVDQGMEGIHEGIPLGLENLQEYLNLRKSMLYVLGGYTGSAKTSLADEIFVHNPYEYMLSQGKSDKLRIVYWSMERKKVFKIAKWVTRKIFVDTGELVPMKRLLGWVKKDDRLSEVELREVKAYKSYFREMFKCVRIIDGRQNPTGIRKEIERIAEQNGQIIPISQFEKKYVPNDPSVIYVHIFDHVGKLKCENGKNIKETIDAFSDDTSNLTRDLFGHTAVVLSQFNRDIANPFRLKQGDVEPRLEDFKNTADLTEDADVAMSIFDPWRYKVLDAAGYDLDRLKKDDGTKLYRSVQVLKSSYDTEGIRAGLAFHPQTGIFKSLPKVEEMRPFIYEAIRNDTFFMPPEVYAKRMQAASYRAAS